jgi:hypothetical protein
MLVGSPTHRWSANSFYNFLDPDKLVMFLDKKVSRMTIKGG